MIHGHRNRSVPVPAGKRVKVKGTDGSGALQFTGTTMGGGPFHLSPFTFRLGDGGARMLKLLRQLPPWALLLLCALYVLSPLDLFPDVLGPAGRLDDLLVALGTLYYIYSGSRKAPGQDKDTGGRGGRRPGGSGSASSGQTASSASDPYDVLGVDRSEGFEEIRKQYKEKLLQYHPDRVAHLGRELQEVAEQKTKEITQAFQRIASERGRDA